MRKKRVLFLIAFIFFALASIKVLAKEIYDLQKINMNVEKPISKFEIEFEMPSGCVGSVCSNSDFYSSDEYKFDLIPNQITVECGTKIKIKDLSTSGSGENIKCYDFQIYTPFDNELIDTRNKKDVEKNMVLDSSGIYDFYLSVMDDYKNVAGFDNWSINGNHRWLSSNPNNKNQYFYWYFSQIQINVLEEGIPLPEEEIYDEIPESLIDEDDKEDDSNSNPQVELLMPDHFYPKEITENEYKVNQISWLYYDEDYDDMKSSGYELYKIIGKEKNLVESKNDIKRQRDCELYVQGNMHEKFYLYVWVIDEEDNKGTISTEFEIEEFFPNVTMKCNDRVYLNDDFEIEINSNDDFNNALILNYEKYQVLKDGHEILNDNGKIPDILNISDKCFEENSTYELIQYISNSYGTVKKTKSNLFVVPIEKPIISMDNISLYYGEEKETNLTIKQPQSNLKGNLKNYEYEFIDSDCYFEIYDGSKLIFADKGKVEKFAANENMNIPNSQVEKIYTIYQYATNGANKTGIGKCNAVIKVPVDDYIHIEIKERDNDPLTIKDEIYTKEHLLIQTDYYAKNKVKNKCTYIYNDKNEVVKKYNDTLNGLYEMDFENGVYNIVTTIETNNNKLSDSVKFEIKKIEKPVISISDIKDKYYKTDNFKITSDVYDVNKSEEHPNGFELSKNYFINDEKHEGIVCSISLNKLVNKNTYIIKQCAVNKEHEDVSNTEEILFYLDNYKPYIESNNNNEYFTNENVSFDITAKDKDGYVKKFDVECDNVFEFVDEKDNEWIKHISLSSNMATNYVFKVIAVDDSNDETIDYITLKINQSDKYPYINLLTKEIERQKINRYIQIEYGTSDGSDAELYVNDKLLQFNNDLYEDDKLKILREGENIAGLYFKSTGTFDLKAKAFGIERKITLGIKDDEIPKAIISANKEYYRNPNTKKALIRLDYTFESDDEIDETILYVNDKVSTMKDDEVELDYNQVGMVKIKMFVKEKHNFLPSSDHPFYLELLEKMKSDFSNEIETNVVNMKPEIFYDTKTTKYKIKIIE